MNPALVYCWHTVFDAGPTVNHHWAKVLYLKPFQPWIYHCHLHPLQVVNWSHNSRLVAGEDDLKWVANERKIPLLLKQLHENFVIKALTLGVGIQVILLRCKMMLEGVKGLWVLQHVKSHPEKSPPTFFHILFPGKLRRWSLPRSESDV